MSHLTHNSYHPLVERWMDDPEPDKIEYDSRIIIDSNMESVTWMYDALNSGEAWYRYEGELMPAEK